MNAFNLCTPCAVRREFEHAGPKKQVEFRNYLVSKGRSGLQPSMGQQRCASVPRFSRSRCSLQLGGVQWTSPRRSLGALIRFTLAVTRTCKKFKVLTRVEEARRDVAKFG